MHTDRHICLKCFHTWRPRTDHKPLKCPQCGNPYWDRQRTMKGASREDAIAHWQKALQQPGLLAITYEYAREALAKLGADPERVPGEDDQ